MNKQKDIFDLYVDERELRQSGEVLLPSYENGFITVRAKNFVDDFDNQVEMGCNHCLKD